MPKKSNPTNRLSSLFDYDEQNYNHTNTTPELLSEDGLTDIYKSDYELFLEEKEKSPLKYKEYLKSDHWQQKRIDALDHYGNSCVLCGSQDNINVHHRNYNNLGHENIKTDLIVLCKLCHEKFHSKD